MFKTIKSPDVTILALKNIRRWIKNMLSSIKLIVKLILCFFVSLSIVLLSIKTLTYKKSTSSEKYGMRTTLSMLLLIFLTTILLAGWGGYYVFFQNNHFSLSMTKLEKK